METITLGTAIGLNNASFYVESVNPAAWNRARLVEAKRSFCWYKCTHVINPTGKFPKRKWEETTAH